ncbi:MAG: gamma-glutamyltransferase family protein [Betaproteobacteria bacterium]|nr:gamma-glutamyltransferase family protein [Betaproteobacteria bacterium]MDE2056588.1 gamma-glutamyltransferase family protein [Betaproteobacteria bacterium]
MTFNWTNPYLSTRAPIFARNIVSTSHPLAAQAGLHILQQGGNAVDATIAAAAVMTIVEPVSNGLGSDCFALVWDGKSLQGLNASGTAPQAWDINYFNQRYTSGARPKRGFDTVTIPGMIKGWSLLHERFGRLPWDSLFSSAIDIAERGFIVTPVVAKKWQLAIPELHNQPGFKQYFMPFGRAPQTGERFTIPSIAKTLGLIAKEGADCFYQGEIAQHIARFAKEHGGAITINDLKNYSALWVNPIQASYEGYEVHEIPPNGQGIAALMALGILKHCPLKDYSADSVDSLHLQIEAMKLAFQDVYQHVADPASMTVSVEQLLDESYLKERAKLISVDKAASIKGNLPALGGTIYLTAADEQGMMVSFIQSNYMGFGSGVVVDKYGISLQNRGYGFSLTHNSPNVVAPNKRPFHTIIPGFVTRKNEQGEVEPIMSFGVMGGDMQPQGHLQTLVRMLHYKQQPQTACDAPRWKVNRDFSLDCETSMSPDTIQSLINKGHCQQSTFDPYMDFGAGQFIWRLSNNPDDGYVAASDPRRDGQAVGF